MGSDTALIAGKAAITAKVHVKRRCAVATEHQIWTALITGSRETSFAGHHCVGGLLAGQLSGRERVLPRTVRAPLP